MNVGIDGHGLLRLLDLDLGMEEIHGGLEVGERWEGRGVFVVAVRILRHGLDICGCNVTAQLFWPGEERTVLSISAGEMFIISSFPYRCLEKKDEGCDV